MAVESLKQLKIDFVRWRRKKLYAAEAIPEDLIKRAKQAASHCGIFKVIKATGLSWNRLTNKDGASKQSGKLEPTFSRVEIASPTSRSPIAEIETPTGFKLRIFTITSETTSLLSSFYRAESGL